MAVGLKDVARLSGVSIATASRVLTSPHLVQEATRERVQRAIDTLQYRPSRVARRLRRDPARTHLVGLVVPDIQNPFFADLARGVENVAQEHGYMVFVGNSDEDADKERNYLELMRAESVDGIILPPTAQVEPALEALARGGIPVVCVDRRLGGVSLDTVVADNVRGAREATEHLIRLGHRRIGFIEGRPHLSTSRERLEGYRHALQDAGAPFDPTLVRAGDSRQASGFRLARELLEDTSPAGRPSALLVGNNLMTLGALGAIRELGLCIPDDVAIIGYDDLPWAPAFDPPLTAVRQPAYEMGRRATELLLSRVDEPQREPRLVVLEPELVVRRSCGAGREPSDAARARRRPTAAVRSA
jgi:DNA-binding LacI/PurR family transcriptional regulator